MITYAMENQKYITKRSNIPTANHKRNWLSNYIAPIPILVSKSKKYSLMPVFPLLLTPFLLILFFPPFPPARYPFPAFPLSPSAPAIKRTD